MTATIVSLILALQSAPALPQALPRQAMPRRGCSAFLWSVSERKLVAVADAAAGTLRLALGGKPIDYARASQGVPDTFGFASTARYAAADVAITLEMTVSTQAELTDGALVQQGTLAIERPGSDAVLVPVAGIIGCAPTR